MTDYALRHWRLIHGDRPLSDAFVCARDLAPRDHLAMQAALQPFVDNAISKTVNVPREIELDAFEDLYAQAYRLGLKGCTAFRPNPITGSVLTGEDGADSLGAPSVGCCGLDRHDE